MNEEQHIIKFKCSHNIDKGLIINNDIFINDYTLSEDEQCPIYTDIYYNNLDIYSLIISDYYNYIINLSNILYKIHNPNYYRKYNCKELI